MNVETLEVNALRCLAHSDLRGPIPNPEFLIVPPLTEKGDRGEVIFLLLIFVYQSILGDKRLWVGPRIEHLLSSWDLTTAVSSFSSCQTGYGGEVLLLQLMNSSTENEPMNSFFSSSLLLSKLELSDTQSVRALNTTMDSLSFY